ncbi:hypothetical protein LCGC14_1043740 [marine sediment metagenome]|uniref:Uncharacterized protein n=1 Tax=marine sediment metagenome TaxID=412755 RepID=A0A0F9NCN5_9ZZZZ
MIFTYATLEAAKEAIPEFCRVKEQDVFIWYVKYPCGEEYQLRTRDQLFSKESKQIVYKYYLSVNYHFEGRDNAMRELKVWEQKLGENIELERHTKTEKGYPVFSHYSLKILRCLI